MIVPYTSLPKAAGGSVRPLLDLQLTDMDDVLVPCLVDSGALNTLLPRWLAEIGGIDLASAQIRDLSVAAAPTRAAFVPLRLTAVGHTWEAPVGFSHPWPYGWGLLGHDAFFRYFTVTFRAADHEFEVEPNID